MDAITDIWFYTALPLMEIGWALDLEDLDHNLENYWEWITGALDGMALDITRTHAVPAADTPTRIFRLGDDRDFSESVIDMLVQDIKRLGIAPIMLGAWIYRSGNDFDMRTVRTIG